MTATCPNCGTDRVVITNPVVSDQNFVNADFVCGKCGEQGTAHYTIRNVDLYIED
jgi:transcription elongation factor Elf1